MARRRQEAFYGITVRDWALGVKQEKMRKARLKREIVKEVAEKIHAEQHCEDDPAIDYDWQEGDKALVLRAARLAIKLWEKRR